MSRNQNQNAIELAAHRPQHFKWHAEGKVGVITIDRPDKKNPLTFESYAELRDFFRALQYARDIKAIVVTGSGGNFCSGGDVHEIIGPLTRMAMPELMDFTRMTGDLIKAMRACPQPVISAIDGICAGAGAMIALFSDLRYDFVRTWFITLENVDFDAFESTFKKLENEGRDAIAASAISPREVVVQRALDMRYVGQEHSVTVDIPERHFIDGNRKAIKELFDAVHAQRYGTSAPDEPAEIASLRTTISGIVEKPGLERIKAGEKTPPKKAKTGARKCFFQGMGFVETTTFARAELLAGNRIQGPALVEEHASTTVVAPGDSLEVDALGNLDILVSGARA